MIFIGIDFGTSNCSIAFIRDDQRNKDSRIIRVEDLKVTKDEESESNRMPTIVAEPLEKQDGKGLLFGWEFWRKFLPSGLTQRRRTVPLLRRGLNLFDSVKSDLGSFRVYPYAAREGLNTPEKVAQAVFEYLMRQAKNRLPLDSIREAHVVITVPASLNSEARNQTMEAAKAAGWGGGGIELVDEPLAALMDLLNDTKLTTIMPTEAPRNILIFDYGGGTLDLSLVKCSYDLATRSGLRTENIAISRYRRNGGNDVDREVMRQVVWPQIENQWEVSRDDLSAPLRRSIEDTFTPTIARRLKEGICNRVKSYLESGGKWTDLQDNVDKHVVPMDFDFKDSESNRKIKCNLFSITVEQFSEVMEDFVDYEAVANQLSDENKLLHAIFGDNIAPQNLFRPIHETLERGKLELNQLDAVIMHGGSCRNPYVRHAMWQELDESHGFSPNLCITETPSIDASVARGAALVCYWRHARQEEIIRPIIAEEIGVLTQGEKPEQLVPAGSPIPYPDEYGWREAKAEFYVPKDNIKMMLVPFYTGIDHELSGIISVDLSADTELHQSDPIRIKFRVDHDKVLHWQYNVKGGEFRAAQALTDPWTNHELTNDERELLAHRREMRAKLLEGEKLPNWMLIREASRLRSTAQYDEAELVLLDYIGEHGLDDDTANLLSLVYGETGEKSSERFYAKRAVELCNYKNAILVGNYGCVLQANGELEQAIAMFRQAISLNGTHAYLYEHLGDILRQQGQEQAAVAEYEQAKRQLEKQSNSHGDNPNIWQHLQRLYKKTGNYECAAKAAAQADKARLNLKYQGDSSTIIGGPDSPLADHQ